MAVAQVRDVAALAGVSPATVSNALNHPDKVSPATRERIQAAITELGFVRNDAARQLRAGVNQSIGMVVLDARNPFFTDVSFGAEEILNADGRPLLLGNSAQDPEREAVYLDLFERQHVSGALVTPAGSSLEPLRRLAARGAQVVLVDRLTDAPDFSSVAVDDQVGGRLAVEHLVEAGRRRIAFVGGPGTLAQIQNRLGAAREVAEQHEGTQIRFVETTTMDATAGRESVLELLRLEPSERPDAIFAGNDLVALGVLQGLTLAGVSVPDDIAIVGYDDISFAGSAAIPLTSVRQPAVELGRTAAQLLLDALGDPDATKVQHVTLEPELVVRASTTGF